MREGPFRERMSATPVRCNSRRPLPSRRPRPALEREVQTRERRREHYRRAHSRLPEHDEFRIGHLHTNSFGCAAVIDDPEQREASIRDHTRQSVDGLCDGLAACLVRSPAKDCGLSSIRTPSL